MPEASQPPPNRSGRADTPQDSQRGDTPQDSQRGDTPQAHIRVIAICLVLHEDHLLMAEGYDHVKDEVFYRALGGEVEFGEASASAAARELREELGRDVAVGDLLGVIENRFTLRGEPGHEIVFEYVAAFAPGHAPEDLEPMAALEGDATFTARWLPLAEVLAGAHRAYPEGVEDRLAAWVNRQ